MNHDNYSVRTQRDIDIAIKNSFNYQDFINTMKKINYEVIERYVLDHGKLQIEVLCHLDEVQEAGAVLIASYPRIEGATGLPCRVWAITE